MITTKPLGSSSEIKPIVAGIGLIALDVVLDETSHAAQVYAGGTCANVLSILSHLGCRAMAIGYIGSDVAGARALADLVEVGVDCEFLVPHDSVRTPVFLQRITVDGGRPSHSFLNECPSCGAFLPQEQHKELPINRFKQLMPDVLFLDRLSEGAIALAKSARANGSIVMYEPSARSDAKLWLEILPLIDLLKYSRDRMSPEEFDSAVTSECHFWEIETAGDRGLRYRRRQSSPTVSPSWTHLEAVSAAHVVDTCGAGDWCTAGLLNELLRWQVANVVEREDIFVHALRIGQARAAWACGYIGARGGMYPEGRYEQTAPSLLSQSAGITNSLCGRAECGSPGQRTFR